MAGDTKKLQPIIVKRVKKGGHAAHGGAWKIAYADFVTAMMAFFLMMWLIGSTTEGDRKGIADYFNSPLRISLFGGGSGSGDASSVVKGGGDSLTKTVGQVKEGETRATRDTAAVEALRGEQRKAERHRLQQLSESVQKMLEGSQRFQAMQSNLRIDMTDDGLRIQIVDSQNRPMFASGSAEVQPYMRDLLREIGVILNEVPNKLTIEGHTDATPFPGNQRGYSNWELSTDRANASRRELMTVGMKDVRVARVLGLAASLPFDKDDPLSPVNRRISITVMSREAEDRFFKSDAALSADPATLGPVGPNIAPVVTPPLPAAAAR